MLFHAIPRIIQKKKSTLLKTSGPGIDHPVFVGYPEGDYLTSLLVHVT